MSLPTPEDVDQAARALALGASPYELHGALSAGGVGFDLLLPDPAAGLEERAQALFDWCRAFLGGFGLAAVGDAPLSDDGAEALADLGKLAQASPELGEGEEDEDALAEIEEFVRVAVLLLHGDCVLAPRHRKSLN